MRWLVMVAMIPLSTGCPGPSEADAGSVDAGTGTATSEFASMFRAWVTAAVVVEPGVAPADVPWSVSGSVTDLQYQQAPGSTIRVGPSGGPSSSFAVSGQFSFGDVFRGPMTAFSASVENRPALLQGDVSCPSFINAIWQFTRDGGVEHHVMTWSPSREPGVIASVPGNGGAQASIEFPDTGRAEWTLYRRVTAPGATMVLGRLAQTVIGPQPGQIGAVVCAVHTRVVLTP